MPAKRLTVSTLLFAFVIAAGATVGIFFLQKGGQDEKRTATVFFDNSFLHSVNLVVGGRSKGSIGARTHLVMQIESGRYHVKATSPSGALVDDDEITIPERSKWQTITYDAVYNIGAKAQYAVVHVEYGKSGPLGTKPVRVKPLLHKGLGGSGSAANKLFRFPEVGVYTIPYGIDQPFPDKIHAPAMLSGAGLDHLCHWDMITEEQDCELFAENTLQRFRRRVEDAELNAGKRSRDPAARSELSNRRHRLGDAYRAQGNLEAALEQHQAALALWEKVAAAKPKWIRRDLYLSHYKAGQVFEQQGNVAAARKHYRIALDLAKQRAGKGTIDEKDNRDVAFLRELSLTCCKH